MAREEAEHHGMALAMHVGRPGETPIQVALSSPGQRGVMQTLMSVRMGMRRIKPTLDKVQESSKMLIGRRKRKRKIRTALKNEVEKTRTQCNRIVAKIVEGTLTDMRVIRKQLELVAKGLSHINKAVEMEEEFQEDDTTLQDALESNQSLAGELRQQMDEMTTLGESWMRIKWNKDAMTAVGRGPPGFIAFSPFTANDPLFDKPDVIQILTDNGRRNGRM